VPKLPRGRGILEGGGVLQGDRVEALFDENNAGIWGEFGRFGVSEGLTMIEGAGLVPRESFDDAGSDSAEPSVGDGESGGGESDVDVEWEVNDAVEMDDARDDLDADELSGELLMGERTFDVE
jgi:hypothetical protein